jgi:CheY-like chemotaxis protein/HPt (histidine-containing phosphotransfer) domain-containing protein
VLIVDDNFANCNMLIRQMGFWGVCAEAAVSGPDALHALQSAFEQNDPFRIAVIDMQMPGMDGEELRRAMLADRRLAQTKIVLMASLGARYGAERCREIGCLRCVTKPVCRAELFPALGLSLEESESTRPCGGRGNAGQPMPSEPPLAVFHPHARVLVAEDNATNQLVALGILKKFGVRADAVGDGAEAVRALETIPYDLVFMDMRMPVMDGVEATRRIRDPRSAVLNRDIPIVAMTANVQQEDRNRCLEAGMNGFVTKPISPEAVRAALEQWLPAAPTAPAAAAQAETAPNQEQPEQVTGERLKKVTREALHEMTAEAPEQAAAEAPRQVTEEGPEEVVFDRAGVFERMMEDEELVQAVLEAFLDDLPKQIAALKYLLEAGDAPGSARLAHTIKGAAANVGGERVRHLAKQMEEAANAADLDILRHSLPGLEARSRELLAAIAESLPGVPT